MTPGTGSASTFATTFARTGIVGGSLPAGRSDLVINALEVKNAAGQALASSQANHFCRFFGDSNGGGVFTVTDLDAFAANMAKRHLWPLTGPASGEGASQGPSALVARTWMTKVRDFLLVAALLGPAGRSRRV